MLARRILLVSLLIPAVLGLTAVPAMATTFTVNSTADPGDGSCDGTCTLRDAIIGANVDAVADTIDFDIPGTGPHTIAVTGAALPTIVNTVTIDGFSDPDDTGRVELDGTGAAAGSAGLTVSGAGSGTTIVGLVINDFGDEAIQLDVGGNTVQGNYLGTDQTGLAAEGNFVGIAVNGSGNTIGGTGAFQGNVISGNDNSGVTMFSATNTVFQGNLVGPGVDGSTDLGNGNQGVHLFGVASNNTIGGTSAGARNVISGNTGAGVAIGSATNTGNIIQGNSLGTKLNGTEALPNNTGIRITAGSSNTIGGTAAGAGNVISGNSFWGVSIAMIADPGPSDVAVQGNLIGTTALGNAALGNGSDGINISDAPNTVVGGSTAAARNVISGNADNGVEVSGGGSDASQVEGNYIGVAADGTADLGNSGHGVLLTAPFGQIATGNSVGGSAAGEGNVISGNAGDGIRVSSFGVQNMIIQGNLIGLASDGVTDRGNDGEGIDVQFVGGTNQIGGTTAAARNVVSGNGSTGMFLLDGQGYTVQGNYIGMDASGTTAVPNAGSGAFIQGTSPVIGGTAGVSVGGNCTGACNLISGNTQTGLTASGGATVRGNYIGTDVTGLLDRGNGGAGMSSSTDSTVLTIGGATSDARNIISGNTGAGLNWADQGANNDVIQGNYIGVGSDGTTAIGNSNGGIFMGGDNNTIGATTAGAGNVIANNGSRGITVNSGATGNAIRGNSIHSNVGLGIDIDPVGAVNPNDLDDPDSGANERQNFPLLGTAEVTGGVVTVNGTLNSVPSSTFALDFYATTSCNAAAPNNHGEGRTYLGELSSVTTDASGDATFTFTSDGSPAVSAGDVITATATDSNGNTSEFSRCRVALGGPSPALSIADASITEGNLGSSDLSFTITLSSPSTDTVTVEWVTADGTAASPGDYQSSSGTATFVPSDTTETIQVPVNGDIIDEGAVETFTVNLSNGGGATISDGQATGTITDDDPPAVSIGDVSVVEGDVGTTAATFTVSLSTPSVSQVTVDWATANGTATAPSDYTPGGGTVMFASLDTTETVSVQVHGDTMVEPDETFILNLSAPSGAGIGDGQGVGTISNDDSPASPSTCPGFESDPRLQLVGTSGPDVLTGGPGAEILCGLGANDRLRGGGGKDLVLGGGGNDRLAGQGGNDVLKGQAGNDKMVGGPGVDRCQGGPGKDVAAACELGRA